MRVSETQTSRVEQSLMARHMCVQRTQQPLIVLHLQPAINTYMDLFTVGSKLKAGSETPTHALFTLRRREWMGVRLACQIGGRRRSTYRRCLFFGISACWDHALGSRALCSSVPESVLHLHKDKYEGWLFPRLCSSVSRCRCSCSQTSFLSPEGGEQNKPPQHCKLLL